MNLYAFGLFSKSKHVSFGGHPRAHTMYNPQSITIIYTAERRTHWVRARKYVQFSRANQTNVFYSYTYMAAAHRVYLFIYCNFSPSWRLLEIKALVLCNCAPSSTYKQLCATRAAEFRDTAHWFMRRGLNKWVGIYEFSARATIWDIKFDRSTVKCNERDCSMVLIYASADGR